MHDRTDNNISATDSFAFLEELRRNPGLLAQVKGLFDKNPPNNSTPSSEMGMQMSCKGIVNTLRDNLLNRYKNEFCILQELIQNADDAQAEQVFVGIVDSLSDMHPLLAAPALFIINDGPVTRSNILSIKEVGNSDKTTDGKKIGKFGLGMKSVFHLAEGFFLFGKNSPVDYPFFVTPWTAEFHPTWGTAWNENKEELANYVERKLSPYLSSWKRWFCVWIPLRRKGDLGRVAPIVKEFPENAKKFITTDYIYRATHLLPMLKNIKKITFFDGKSIYEEVDIKAENRLTGENGVFGGTADTKGKISPFQFIGQEKVDQSNVFEQLRQSPFWPESMQEDEEKSTYFSVKDKTQAHAGICIVRDNTSSSAFVRVNQCVYLPLTDSTWSERISGEASYTINMHGGFFVDAGRQDLDFQDNVSIASISDEKQLRGCWNSTLLNQSVLPLLIPELDESKKVWGNNAISDLMRGLQGIPWIRKNMASICRDHCFVKELTKDGCTWSMLNSFETIYELRLPEDPQFLCAIAQFTPSSIHIIDKDAPQLRKKLNQKPSADLIQRVVLSASKVLPIDTLINSRTIPFWLDFFETYYIATYSEELFMFWKRVFEESSIEKYNDFIELLLPLLNLNREYFVIAENLTGIKTSDVELWKKIIKQNQRRIVLPKFSVSGWKTIEIPSSQQVSYSTADANSMLLVIQDMKDQWNSFLKVFVEEIFEHTDIQLLSSFVLNFKYWEIESVFYSYNQLLSLSQEDHLYLSDNDSLAKTLKEDFSKAVQWSLICIPRSISRILNLNVSTMTKEYCFSLLMNRPQLNEPEKRKDLLQDLVRFASNYDAEDDLKRICRYLIHGNTNLFDCLDELLTPLKGEFYSLTSMIVKSISQRKYGFEYELPELLLNQLNSTQRGIFGLPESNENDYIHTLAQYTDISFSSYPDDAWEILLKMADYDEEDIKSCLKKIPLFISTTGKRTAIDKNCYRERSVKIPEIFYEDVTILAEPRRQDKGILSRYEAITNTWNNHDTLSLCMKKAFSEGMNPFIIAALKSNIYLAQEEKDYLSRTPWVQISDGSYCAPNHITALNTLQLVPESDRVSYKHISEIDDFELQKLITDKDLILGTDKSIQVIFDLLSENTDYYIGHLNLYKNSEQSNLVSDILESFKDSEEMPIIDIFGSFVTHCLDISSYLSAIQKTIPSKRLVRIIKGLSNRAIQSHSETQQKSWKFLLNYLDEAAEFSPDFLTHILPEISLFSKKKQYHRTSELCFSGEGIEDNSLLDIATYRVAEHFIDALNQNPTDSTQNEEIKRSISIIDYTKGWDQSFDERLGGFIICCTDQPDELNYVKSNLNFVHRNIALVRESLSRPLNSFMQGQRVALQVRSEDSINVTALDGSPLTVSLKSLEEAQNLLYGPVSCRLLPANCIMGKNNETGNVLILRLRQPSQEQLKTMQPDHLDDLLKNTLAIILKTAYPGMSMALDEFWDNLLHGEQLDINATKAKILSCAVIYLPMLGCKNDDIDQVFSRWHDEWYASIQAKENKNDAEVRRCQERMDKLLDDLRRDIAEKTTIQDEILSALRQKMRNSYNYSEDSILFELFQNADDASEELRSLYHDQNARYGDRFVVDFDGHNLIVVHWGRQINQTKIQGAAQEGNNSFKRDLEKMLLLSQSDKEKDDLDVVGKFGLGFKSVFLVTDRPLILSGRLRFSVVGGFLPEALADEEQIEISSIRDRYYNYSGVEADITPTIFVLPILPESVEKVQQAIKKFCEMASIISIFAKKIRKIEINTPEFTRTFESDVSRNNLQEITLTIAGDQDQYRLFNLCKAQMLMGCKDGLLTTLSEDIPTFWATAPTHVCLGLGIVINGNFDLDTGRAFLNTSSTKNEEYAKVVSDNLYQALIGIWELKNSDNTEEDNFLSNVSAYDWFESMWNVFTNNNAPDKWSLKQQNPSISLMQKIIWPDNAGYKRFASEYKVIPSCLEEPYKQLCKMDEIEFFLNDQIERIGWLPCLDRRKLQPGKVVSEKSIKKAIDEFFPHSFDQVKVYDVEDFIQDLSVEHECLEPAWCASDSGESFYKGLQQFNNICRSNSELNVVKNACSKFCFIAEDGTSQKASELLLVHNPEDISEDAKTAFAPQANVLSGQYDENGVALFLQCRGVNCSINNDRLVSWALQADSYEKQAAVFRFIIESPEANEFCNCLKTQLEGTWLSSDKLIFNDAYLSLTEHDMLIVVGRLKLNPDIIKDEPEKTDTVNYDPSAIVDNCVSDEEVQDHDYIQDIYNWWQFNKEESIRKYNNRLYGRDQVRDLTFDLNESDSRQDWMELLVLGSAHTLGMKLGQHRGFIQFLRRRGYWETYCAESIDADDWLETLDDFLDLEEFNSEFGHWMRLFIRIYQFAKYLNNYTQVFEWWNSDWNPQSVLDLTNIQTNPAFTGTGLRIPGLYGALGKRYATGLHFVCREMVRRNVIHNRNLYKFCFVPYKGAAEITSSSRRSESIYDSVVASIGEECATFDKAFDIALLAYKKGF